MKKLALAAAASISLLAVPAFACPNEDHAKAAAAADKAKPADKAEKTAKPAEKPADKSTAKPADKVSQK